MEDCQHHCFHLIKWPKRGQARRRAHFAWQYIRKVRSFSPAMPFALLPPQTRHDRQCYRQSGNDHVETFLCVIFLRYLIFVATKMCRNTSPCSSSFLQECSTAAAAHADWQTCQFQTTEWCCTCSWRCTCMDHAYPPAMPSSHIVHFSDCLGTYGRRQ